MRKLALVVISVVLSGCAQVFEGNLFQNIDPPPPLSASAMSDASLEDIQNQLADPNSASAFYEQLNDNPKALKALQDNLNDQITAATAPADKVEAAQALVLVTAYGTQTAETVNEAIEQASNLQSGGTPADAIAALMSGKSLAQITAELTQFATMQAAFAAMAQAAEVANVVDADLFYGSASAATQGDLAQIALVTAAAAALIIDNTDIATLAGRLFTGTGLLDNGTEINLVSDAMDAPLDPDSNAYAYLSAATSIVPF